MELLALALLGIAAVMAAAIRGMVRHLPARCWLGHNWVNHGSRWWPDWSCSRCETPLPPCHNFGSQHDPGAFIVCIVNRGWNG